LLGPFTSAGYFDECLETGGLVLDSFDDGEVKCSLVVPENLLNNLGAMHGGAICTLVDVVGTLALLTKDPSRPGVSTEMNQSFCSAAKLGETIRAEGRVLKYGKRLGFAEVTLRLDDGRVVATGRHTKFYAG